ncbi:EAL domain-containing protein [Tahibacter amnicola]|uniref:EAL domain-containing protein n=1 Tax=Tahibacter amnicola TaxID=2976241 RepID=A0ABY6BC00_9GAMM|nr:EAL domain-containing protein [Tahibacter amnicola]UXI65845.1 EAL domain-containing protein [Tahibacter amnicola]
MASSAIFATFVDRFGFVWFAGDNGVHRFDGHDVRSIDRDPDQPGTLVSRTNADMAQTRDALWILSFAGVLQRLDSTTGVVDAYTLERNGIHSARGTHVVADREENLWVSTDRGLFRFDPRSRRALPVDLADGEQPRVTALALSEDGHQLFAGCVDGRVFRIAVSDFRRADLLVSLGQAVALEIVPAGEHLWLGTAKGLYHYDPQTGIAGQSGIPSALMHGKIDAMTLGRDGALWIGGAHHVGLLRFDPASGSLAVYRHQPDDPYSLSSDRVAALVLDDRDNLWVGLQRDGANRLRVGQHGATRYRAPEGRSNSFCAAREQADGRLLVLLCGGSVGVLDPRNGEFEDRSADIDRALSFTQPTLSGHAIVADAHGGYWLPTNNTGLLHWHPQQRVARRYRLVSADGREMPDPYMNAAVQDAEGRLWVGCSIGLAVLARGDSALRLFDPASTPGGALTGGVLSVALADDGKLWLGTTQGLVHFDPATNEVTRHVHNARDKRSLSDNLVIATHVDSQGTLWVGTQAGLNRASFEADGVHFRRYLPADGLPDQTIDAITSDTRGTLWVGTNRGIASRDAAQDRFVAFSSADGVPDIGVNWRSVLAATDGSVYFGSASGLLRLFPERLSVTPPQPLMLGSYEVGGVERINLRGPDVASLRVDYTQARVRFNVAAFGDHRPISYRLAGLQSRWQDMPASLSIGYDPLPPGNYRFEARQMGGNGQWLSPTLSVSLTVSPPPWRTRGAYAIYAASLLGVLLLAVLTYRQRRANELRHLGQLQQLATYDALTGLPNRTRFVDELAAAIDHMGPTDKLALMFIDLDRFKNINDSLGHRFGDLVLTKAAQRLRRALPQQARLARLGGDEFTVILPRLQHETEPAVVAQALLDAFATPLRVEASDVVVTLSLGISRCPLHATDPLLLVQYADTAMYYAKHAGRNAFCVFQPEMIAQVSRRLTLETGLRQALANDELHLVYQPQVDFASDQVCGVEVLLRWRSAEHGNVTPAEFIPILEDTGLIHEVGAWVVEQVCRQLQTWIKHDRGALCVAVNVSAHQLMRGELVERLAQLLATLSIPRRSLELEITESTLMDNAQRASSVLHELRSLGLGVAIDDFGTGYSSFAALSRLPFDKLKIDKTFVDGVGTSTNADTLCAAIIAMAHNLKLQVVAEGVETELQHRQLKAMGCDYAQGYWYCRPVSVGEFEQFLEQRRQRAPQT